MTIDTEIAALTQATDDLLAAIDTQRTNIDAVVASLGQSNPANWALTSYTVDTWTDVAAAPAVMTSIMLSNTDAANEIVVELRVADGGVEVAQIVPPATLAANSAQTLDLGTLRSLVLTGTQHLQLRASAAGIHVFASGAL